MFLFVQHKEFVTLTACRKSSLTRDLEINLRNLYIIDGYKVREKVKSKKYETFLFHFQVFAEISNAEEEN